MLIEVTVVTVILPLVVFLLLRSIGKISTIMAPKIKERKMPLVIQCFLVIVLIKKGITVGLYPEFHFFFLAGLMSTLLALGLLFAKIKASLHMIGISALTFFIFGLNLHANNQNVVLIAVLFMINGLVALSRIEMRAHTPKELAIGFVLGSLPQFLLMYLWL
ncbi:MAG: hypothetical protein QG594_1661 [Bacteroidota bacterium]|nr:hypothetical protein [Bacteroidota bacterium]